MAGTPEEDLLEWLEREEENLGFTAIEDALQDIEKARRLLFDELGYDLTEEQFSGLRGALETKYESLPSISVSHKRVEQKWGYQDVYRDVVTGRYVSGTDVWALLGAIR